MEKLWCMGNDLSKAGGNAGPLSCCFICCVGVLGVMAWNGMGESTGLGLQDTSVCHMAGIWVSSLPGRYFQA